jgi:imidazolonepropionase-like amidohydrolase
VIPGLIDAHCHVMNVGYLATVVDGTPTHQAGGIIFPGR